METLLAVFLAAVVLIAIAVGGMTAKEIGLHLGIAEKSVFNILDRARKALHAASTIEAVAKALVYELI